MIAYSNGKITGFFGNFLALITDFYYFSISACLLIDIWRKSLGVFKMWLFNQLFQSHCFGRSGEPNWVPGQQPTVLHRRLEVTQATNWTDIIKSSNRLLGHSNCPIHGPQSFFSHFSFILSSFKTLIFLPNHGCVPFSHKLECLSLKLFWPDWKNILFGIVVRNQLKKVCFTLPCVIEHGTRGKLG